MKLKVLTLKMKMEIFSNEKNYNHEVQKQQNIRNGFLCKIQSLIKRKRKRIMFYYIYLFDAYKIKLKTTNTIINKLIFTV